jgi:peptide/nickel transport system substrate-binding protein
LLAVSFPGPAAAQKQGGILRVHVIDSPPSVSMHEEAAPEPARAVMGIFNNLVMFDQHVNQNNFRSIVSDLATGWSWSEDGTQLTFRLRDGVKWHDGRPFTAKDVQCTWDLLLGKSQEKLRINPRKAWYQNVEAVAADADLTATFHLKRPQRLLPAATAPWALAMPPSGAGPAQTRVSIAGHRDATITGPV